MKEYLANLFSDGNHTYSTLITIVAILFVVYAIFSKIRYECLKIASRKVAEIEKMEHLTGEQKFALVVTWIDDSLPKVFRNSLVKNVIKELVQFAYDNSVSYAKNYIKRKTGLDISELLQKASPEKEESSEST